MSRGGIALLAETARVAGIEGELRAALAPWRRARAVHAPARVVVHLGFALAAGGDCLADIGVLRDATAVVGAVASDPTVSRVIDDLAAGGQDVLDAIAGAHAAARARVHAVGGGPAGSGPVPLDIDATLVTSHSDKEDARPTYKRGFGHHPVIAFLDHGDGGTGEALAGLLRAGNTNANNAADLLTTLDLALAQLPAALRERVLIRCDGGGYSHKFFDGSLATAPTTAVASRSTPMSARQSPPAGQRGLVQNSPDLSRDRAVLLPPSRRGTGHSDSPAFAIESTDNRQSISPASSA